MNLNFWKLLFSGNGNRNISQPENDANVLMLRFSPQGKKRFLKLREKSGLARSSQLISQALNVYGYIISNLETFRWVSEEAGAEDIVPVIHEALEYYRIYCLDVKAGRRRTFVFPEPITAPSSRNDA